MPVKAVAVKEGEVKSKTRRRERFTANEERVEKTLRHLDFIQKHIVWLGATQIAMKKALAGLGEIGGLKKLNLGGRFDELFEKELSEIYNPKVEAGEHGDNEVRSVEGDKGIEEAIKKEIEQNPSTVEQAGVSGYELLDGVGVETKEDEVQGLGQGVGHNQGVEGGPVGGIT